MTSPRAFGIVPFKNFAHERSLESVPQPERCGEMTGQARSHQRQVGGERKIPSLRQPDTDGDEKRVGERPALHVEFGWTRRRGGTRRVLSAAGDMGTDMGARGSDAALEQAEVVLMHGRLENFLTAFQLSRRARAIIRQNLVISLCTVALLVTFALLGKIPLTLGVLGHESSTLIVVLNSLGQLLRR